MKAVHKLGIVLLGLCFLAGCFFKPQITKEQQNNVVTWIARGYEVKEVEFISFTKNESTGSYTLKMKINGNDSMKTGVLIERFEEFDNRNGILSLNPIDNFKSIKRAEDLDETASVSIEGIKIKYIGEK